MWWLSRLRERDHNAKSDESEWARPAEHNTAASRIVDLQQAVGNQSVQRMISVSSLGISNPLATQSSGAGGEPLPHETREVMEARFGADFSDVRVHTDQTAAESAAALDASAYTTGRDIYFAPGAYAPATLAHELTHVIQQGGATSSSSREEASLEREADLASTAVMLGRRAEITGAHVAPPIQRQPAPGVTQTTNWKAGDVFADPTAATQIKLQGGLFSGNDQAHVNVSALGKLAYDPGYTVPEDPFRWSRLKDIVDSSHLKISAVSDQKTFKVQEAPGGPPVDRSIADIRSMMGDIGVMGITLRVGGQSPDPSYDHIYYDKDQGIGALTHELFGHEWLALKGAPSVHPPAGSVEEQTKGTLSSANAITDPFGNVFSGTVRAYIAKYIESLGTTAIVKTTGGQQRAVPKSPTQQVGVDALTKAFSDLNAQAPSGLTKNTYSAPLARAWRLICNNYDLMQGNLEAMRAGNTNLLYTKEVLLGLCFVLFGSWAADQQSGFRILLADFNGNRAGWTTNELSTKLEGMVGAAPSPFNPAGGPVP
jgi:hypothetical protein